MERYDARLRAEGLVSEDGVAVEFIAALAEAPFTATREHGPDRCWTFGLHEVLAWVAEAETE